MPRLPTGSRSDGRQRRALDGYAPFPVVTPTKTAAYTAKHNELVVCDPTAGGFTVTLPRASGFRDEKVGVKNASASMNAVTVEPYGAEEIDGAASATVSGARVYLEFVSDGEGWLIV